MELISISPSSPGVMHWSIAGDSHSRVTFFITVVLVAVLLLTTIKIKPQENTKNVDSKDFTQISLQQEIYQKVSRIWILIFQRFHMNFLLQQEMYQKVPRIWILIIQRFHMNFLLQQEMYQKVSRIWILIFQRFHMNFLLQQEIGDFKDFT